MFLTFFALQNTQLYKGIIILYLAIFISYDVFTRVPDYFEGDFIKGVVSRAGFSEKEKSPELVIDYPVGSEVFHYKTDQWFLKSYKVGDKVMIIYNPEYPAVSSIYAFIGYWIKWPELLFTAFFFIVLFIAAKGITGTNRTEPLPTDGPVRKRRYKD